MSLDVEALDLTSGKGWRFYSSMIGKAFRAPILDKGFLESIDTEGIRFGKGDKIKALVRMTQPAMGRQRWEILSVLEHIRRAEQGELGL